MLTNWKTTLLGILAGAAQIVPAFGHFGKASIPQVITGVSTFLLGLFAKDHDVTGGVRPNQ